MSEDVGENEEPIKSSSVVHQDDGAVLAPHRLACNHHLNPTQLLHQKLKWQIFEMYLYIYCGFLIYKKEYAMKSIISPLYLENSVLKQDNNLS